MGEFRDTAAEYEQHRLLWEKFRTGDEASFDRLTEVFYHSLFNYALKLSRDEEFAADCLQELFLELWERRAFLNSAERVGPYLFKALRNKVIKESIKLKRFRETAELDFISDEDTSAELLIVTSESEREKINQLKRLLKGLTKRQQEIIYLRFYQNLEFNEISDIMGLTRQSVANLLHRTINDIRNKWIILLFLLVFYGGYLLVTELDMLVA